MPNNITRNPLQYYKNCTVQITGYIEKFGNKNFDGNERIIDVNFNTRLVLYYNMAKIIKPIYYIVPECTTLLKDVTVYVNNRGKLDTLFLDHLWISENIQTINPTLNIGSQIPLISGTVAQYARSNGTWDYTIIPDFIK